jgi:CheY-like chemotaxis protein
VPLPAPLIPPPGFLGVSLQPDGKLISIVDPTALSETIANRRSTALTNAISPAPTTAKSRTKSILVVDDAALMRRRLEASLKHHGFTIYTCNDGLEALNWIKTHSAPDLMITDVEMPNMDGFTLIDRLRHSGMEFPILVVSSRSTEDWLKESRRIGANDFLNKGFSTATLIEKVDRLLLAGVRG